MSESKPYHIRTVKICVLPEGEPIFAETATHIEIRDDAAGEFLAITQEGGAILINPAEWPTLRKAIDDMMKEIAAHG